MIFKVIVFAAYVAVASAGILGYSAPSVTKVAAYSSAPAVSYSSVSSPVATYSASPAYAKLATPTLTYSAPAYKVAAPIAYSAPITKEVYADTPANYEFGYSVNDPHTGDSKSQQESRHGDVVHGSYSFIEADGSKRIVEYTVDAHSGFNAVVHKEPGAVKTVAPVVAKVATPLIAKAAAPIGFAAPSYAVPVTKYSAAPAVSYSSVSSPIAAAPAYAKVAAPAYYH